MGILEAVSQPTTNYFTLGGQQFSVEDVNALPLWLRLCCAVLRKENQLGGSKRNLRLEVTFRTGQSFASLCLGGFVRVLLCLASNPGQSQVTMENIS